MPTRTRPWLSLFFVGALAAAAVLLSAGCDYEHPTTDKAYASDTQNPGVDVPALTLADLPSDLNLTSEQRAKMEDALKELRTERRDRAQTWRSHRGGQGSGPGGPPLVPFGDGGPPMIGFLEKASQTLNPDQLMVLAKAMVQRREQMRSRVEDGRGRFLAELPRRAAGWLDLTSDQQEKMHAALTRAATQMRGVWKSLEDGTATAEQARDQAHAVRTGLKTEMKSILTAEQWTKVDEFRQRRVKSAINRRGDRLDKHLDGRVAFVTKILGLNEQQAAQAQQIMQGTVTDRHAVLDQIQAGTLEPEDAAFKVWQIEKDAAQKTRALLTPEQAQRFDALLLLLPKGVHPGPDLGLGIGGPGAGGPGMGRHGPDGERGGRYSRRGARGGWRN